MSVNLETMDWGLDPSISLQYMSAMMQQFASLIGYMIGFGFAIMMMWALRTFLYGRD